MQLARENSRLPIKLLQADDSSELESVELDSVEVESAELDSAGIESLNYSHPLNMNALTSRTLGSSLLRSNPLQSSPLHSRGRHTRAPALQIFALERKLSLRLPKALHGSLSKIIFRKTPSIFVLRSVRATS